MSEKVRPDMPPMTPSRIVDGDPTGPPSPLGNHPSNEPKAVPNNGPTILSSTPSGDCPDIRSPQPMLLPAIMRVDGRTALRSCQGLASPWTKQSGENRSRTSPRPEYRPATLNPGSQR